MGKTSEQKKQTRKYILWGVTALAVLVLAVMPMLAAGNSGSDTTASILTATVEKKNIEKQLIGGGQLSSDAYLNVSIPENVKLTQYLVGNGDVVSEGDAIAKVDKISVMTAITQVQETLDYLSTKIASASGEEASATVTALAGGTVKAVYAQKGDSVQDVMLEYGALAVLSLDGKMEVDIACESDLRGGDSVTVKFPNGDTAEGMVRSNLEGILTVSLDDADYDIGAEVSVTTEDGKTLGTGELYLSSPWNATAYSGSVSSVWVDEGDTVSVGRTLFSLEDTGDTADFQRLIDQRQEYEELMQELFQMYRTETITAPCDGIVTGVDTNGAFLLSSGGDGWIANLLSFLGSGSSSRSSGTDETYQLVLLSEVEYLEESCTGEADCPAQSHDPGCKALCDGTKNCTAINHKDGCLSQIQEDPPMLTVSIVTPALSDGIVGQGYTVTLQASDGTNVLSGSWGASGLPEGLQMDAESGVISGTPAAEGSFPVTVSFTYGDSTVTKNYTLTVTTAQATAGYRGYVAQIVEISEGNLKVKQTSYSYTITDLNHLPDITAIDQNALTEEASYPAEENLSVNDYVLIILDADGVLNEIVKLEITPGGGMPSGGSGMPSGGSGMAGGGGMTGGGTGQTQTFTLYSLDKVTVASVTSQEHMSVAISVDELDITKIYVGQEATITVDALGGEQFDAAVTGIANSGSNSGGNSKFAVELTLEKSGDMLPGMYCSAFITLNTAEDALCIPVAALDEDGDDTIVYTDYDEENGLRNPVTVTVGISDGENVEILSGLNQGETCYYAYYDTYAKTNSKQSTVSFQLLGTDKNRGR